MTLNIFSSGKLLGPKNPEVVSSLALNASLVSIADHLYSPKKPSILQKDAARLHAFLKAQKLDANWVKETSSTLFRHYISEDSDYLLDQSEELVFNYKHKSPVDLQYLLKYYSGLSAEVFSSTIVG